MLLFGSVAKGTADGDSDIDLVAIFDDIDYTERLPQAWRLESLCKSATGKPVDVYVTDWPEWDHRVNHVGSSLEAAIREYGSWLFRDGANQRLVDWEKEIAKPKTDLEEAATHLYSIRKALGGLIENCSERSYEISIVDGVETVDHDARGERLTSLCSEAALIIEHSVKCLTALTGAAPKHSHNIAVLLDGCLEVPARMLEALEPLRINTLRKPKYASSEYDDISCWRILGTYTGLVPLPETATFGELAARLSQAALMSAETTLDRLLRAGINSDDAHFKVCFSRYERASETAASHDITSGKPLHLAPTEPNTKPKRRR